MKTKIKIIKTLASIAVLAFASNSAYAAGTTAGTGIDNTASISYSVGGTSQVDIESSPTGNSTPGPAGGTPTSFVVDKKVDLVVTGNTTNAPVAPGSTTQTVTYTVTNEGNSAESFDLSANATVAGDNFDPNTCSVTSPVTSTIALAADQTLPVTITCNIPAGSATVVDGAIGSVDLLATIDAAVIETVGGDTVGEDVVFADSLGTATDGAAENGSHAATSSFVISSATLTVTKTQAVTTMMIDTNNDGTLDTATTGDFFHIPGALVTYTITVSNANGADAARSLVISDTLSTNLEFQSCSVSGPAVQDTVHPAPVSTTAETPTCGNSVPLGTAGGTLTTSSFTLPGGSGSANVETLTIVAEIL